MARLVFTRNVILPYGIRMMMVTIFIRVDEYVPIGGGGLGERLL